MILKYIDDKSSEIKTLGKLLEKSNSIAQKKLIDTQLKKIVSGDEAEQENAYYLNFALENSKNVLLLHDIRLEHKGRTAQFDHILISRFGIELLETKSSKGTITINNDGSMIFKNGKYTNTYPNPIEQSKRHAAVLKEFISDSELLSKRIDILGGINISSKVLIHPKTTVTNNELPDGFERADSFLSNRNKEIDNTSILKAISWIGKAYDINKAKEIANLLIDAHKPLLFDYAKKFKVNNENIEINIKEVPVATNSIDENTKDKDTPIPCPRCKEGELIVRKVKSKTAQEKYNNDEFIGCSRYPKCKYTEDK